MDFRSPEPLSQLNLEPLGCGTLSPPYGDKEYAYCENSSCKARLIIQGDKAEGHALSHVCPVLEGDGRNGGAL